MQLLRLCYQKIKSHRPACVVLTLALLLALAGMKGFSQTDTGSVVGTVFDSSGAVIAGAQVDVTDTATNVVHSFTTNSSGGYVALQLIPGIYSVKATHAGYSTGVRENITIDVQTRAQVDFTLKVGTVQQQVQVSTTTVALQTQSAEVGGLLDAQVINELPLNGRDYDQLALLEPGVYHNPNNEVANAAEGRFSANGNLELQNYFSLDGIDNNTGSENLQEQSVQAVTPPPDALQEFAVQTRTYSAEFGTSAGAVLNVSTKSGTNHFHGDVWDYLQNSALDANTYFNNYGGVPKGHFSQNQFGGTVGGPIIRNRTFFFASYEDLRSSEAETVESTVPTAAMKTGDFSSVLSNHPMTAEVPSQAGCITNNVISTTKPGCIDPVGSAIMALYPNPTPQLGNVNVFTGAPNYEYQTSVPNNTYTLDTRIDHTINAKNQIFGRYAYDNSNYDSPMWTSNPIAGNGDFSTDYILHDQSVALGWTYTPSSSLVNTAHFGFLRDYSHSDPVDLPIGVSDAPQVGLTGIPVTPETAGIPASYLFGLTTVGTAIYRPQFQVAQVFQFVDSAYKLIGNHSLQLGYEYHQNSLNFFDLEAPGGAIEASGIYTNTNGFGVADFLMGNASTAIYETALEVNNYMRGNSIYAQDTWRVKPNLTINYGLRYELYPPFWLNRTNETANFSAANGGEMLTATGNNGLAGRVLMNPDRTDIAPRIGFAYHMFPNLVWRGGYGVFHQFINKIGSESMLQLNPPFLLDESLSQSQGSTTPVFQLKNGFPAATLLAQGVHLPNLQLRAQDPNERTSYVEQASFGPQYQIGNNTVLNLTWVGNWGRKMNRLRNANQGVVTGFSGGNPLVSFPYANLNTAGVTTPVANGAGTHAFLELATNDGNSDFNALEASLKRQLSHGLMYTVSYTWSHNMADWVDNLTGGSTPQNAYNYAAEMSNSTQDVRQRLVGSATWELPIGEGGMVFNNSGIASRLIGHWQANAIVSLQTGIPFDVTAPDSSDTGSNHASYPNCAGNPFTGTSGNYVGSNAPGSYLNYAAFTQPAAGTFGNCTPRAIHGPGIEQEDLALFKSFPLGGTRKFQFRAEFFNAFNHPSFANPGADISTGASGFGRSTATTTNPREIQLVGKFFF
jgi:hypothetical protein